jgi:hypothetical protein
MTQDEFNRIVETFDTEETMRSALYYRALNLIDTGFVIDAHILILATWNFARFRYVTTTFDLPAYETLTQRLARELIVFGDSDLMNASLEMNQALIVRAFDDLARITGIEFTGAAKMLHLLNRRVFVMWDRAIMGRKGSSWEYDNLEVVRSGLWTKRKFPQSGLGYYEFLLTCRNKFRGLVSPEERKTLAKCIDEFNFSTITVPD